MRRQHLVDMLAAIDCPGPGLFNPYSDAQEDPEFDVPGGAKIRRQNFSNYLAQFHDVDALLVGEAPGPWGCRFSGMAFTSEYQLVNGLIPVAGKRSSNFPEPCKEQSGMRMWELTGVLHPRVFLWNSLPFHPFHPDEGKLTIRAPTRKEQETHVEVLKAFVKDLQPQRVIAIGRRAQDILGRLGIACDQVRHPSFGGVPEFRAGLAKHLGVTFQAKVEVVA